MSNAAKADYGIDAPHVIRNLVLSGLALIILCLIFPKVTVGSVTFLLFPGLVWSGGWIIAGGVMMYLYSKVGKFRHRDRMLNQVKWTGTEQALDVGTGRGLLLIGAAKRITTGKAVGIDIWNQEDLSGNNLQNLERNIEIEGVRDRTEIRNEDAQKMSAPDGSFDVIVSLACLHNIYNAPGRARACNEIARVLKPGGTAIISDFRHMGEYLETFRKAGLDARKMPLTFDSFPPMRILTARKPLS
ncbi:MAG TPA: class I SAM-dependent methyltransferase [Candidatus Acidoferrales bacterium]